MYTNNDTRLFKSKSVDEINNEQSIEEIIEELRGTYRGKMIELNQWLLNNPQATDGQTDQTFRGRKQEIKRLEMRLRSLENMKKEYDERPYIEPINTSVENVFKTRAIEPVTSRGTAKGPVQTRNQLLTILK
jgi:exoribonuclease II